MSNFNYCGSFDLNHMNGRLKETQFIFVFSTCGIFILRTEIIMSFSQENQTVYYMEGRQWGLYRHFLVINNEIRLLFN